MVRAADSGFVTNSHCTTVQGGVEGTQYFQPTSTIDSVAIGSELADPSYAKEKCPTSLRGKICRWSDSAFVKHAAGASATLGALHKTDGVNNGSLTIAGAFNIVAEAAALKGETVNKVGRDDRLVTGHGHRDLRGHGRVPHEDRSALSDARQRHRRLG